jgi:transglutaminase-like putative cysteine protease
MKGTFKMRTPLSYRFVAGLFLLCFLTLAGAPAALAQKDWLPVEPAHLALKEPTVERDADAEVIFWEVRLAYLGGGYSLGTELQHYIRVKIFNERGRDAQSKVDLIAPKIRDREIKIRDVAGRTIKPDGTITELKKEDIFEREVVKGDGIRVRATSFALPGVEPGSVVEYRWREVRNGIGYYEQIDFSRDIPVQMVKYFIKPPGTALYSTDGKPLGLRAQTFNTTGEPFVKEKNGLHSLTKRNVPAFREEPRMPPALSVRPWMLIFYTSDTKNSPDEFWRTYARGIAEALKPLMKPNDEVKRMAAQVAGDAVDPEQKLRRLFDYVRANVKLVTDDALGLTPEQLRKIKENKSPADTLRRGTGDGADINMLFAAMASAAGFDVRVACAGDRGDAFFMKDFLDDYFIDPVSVAVRVGDGWRLFDPGSSYTTFGMLRWQEEGVPTLIADTKEPVWINSPISASSRSLEKRVGRFKLDEEGTLEGSVRIEYTGHLAADMKEYNDDDSPAQREETLKERLKSRLGAVEVSEISIENVTDPDKPFVYKFHVRVPNYAQRTGKRLFFQPAFFQRGTDLLFPTSARRHDVYFHYPWAEEDSVEIQLPEGFDLDSGESPLPVGAGPISRYEPKAGITNDGRRIIYSRKFFFGGEGGSGANALLFPAQAYSQLKTYFDAIHKQDGHTLAARQGAAK